MNELRSLNDDLDRKLSKCKNDLDGQIAIEKDLRQRNEEKAGKIKDLKQQFIDQLNVEPDIKKLLQEKDEEIEKLNKLIEDLKDIHHEDIAQIKDILQETFNQEKDELRSFFQGKLDSSAKELTNLRDENYATSHRLAESQSQRENISRHYDSVASDKADLINQLEKASAEIRRVQ